jgi:Fe2+ transport system protein FeoA
MKNPITKGLILNVSSNADVYTRGVNYYREGKILSTALKSDPNGQTVIQAAVEGNYKNYEVTLRMGLSGALKHYSCSCESHSIWRGACKHVVAVLTACAEGMAYSLLPGQMSQKARALTDALEKCIYENIDSQLPLSGFATKQPVRLVPVFHAGNQNEAHLTLRAGTDKLYMVKDISNFAASAQRGETIAFGSRTRINLTRSMFEADCLPLLDFVLREESLYEEFLKQLNKHYYFMGRGNKEARILRLTPQSVDSFFALCLEDGIYAETENRTRLSVFTQLPEFPLLISHGEEETRLRVPPFPCRFITGRLYQYLYVNDALYRVNKYDASMVRHLSNGAADAPGGKILFTGSERIRFLSVILPRLTAMGLVAGTEGEAPVLTGTGMRAKLYFDAEGQDIVSRAEFIYGDYTLNPLERLAEEPPILRDAAAEYGIRRQLTALGFVADEKRAVFRMSGNEIIYDFLQSSINSLREAAEVYVTDALRNKTIQARAPVMGLRLEGNLLHVTLDGAGYTAGELLEALESYRSKKKFHRLRDGRFLSMEADSVGQAMELVSALDVTRRDVKDHSLTLSAYRALYVNELTRDMAAARDDGFRKLIGDINDPPHYEEPLKDVLREYQKSGFRWLKALARYGFGGILADDMGLGKTLQVIALLVSEQGEGIRSLVVAPTSLLYNWDNEIKRFAPMLSTCIVAGPPEKRKELLQTNCADVYITTYDMMKRDTAAYESLSFEYVIADEAQNIKNAGTQNAKSVKEIKARVKFALTGTPIENTLSELWSIFDMILPGYLYSSHKFSRLYEYPIVKGNDTERAERLKKQIAPFILRRIKKNVLTELPDKTETLLQADLLPEQKKIYQAQLLAARGELNTITANRAFSDSRIQILAQLTRLRQICCHPSLYLENYKDGSGKLELALETIQMAVESGHRILLFSQFTSMLGIIKQALDNSPYAYFYLDGATQSEARMEMTRRFNGGERDLFLISLKAGGTGLNLTGADVVIHYDPWWNPSVMDQASDRAHRYGQEKAVQVFNLVAKDTIEEKIMALQYRKRDLIDSVISEGGAVMNKLSEEEIRSLFYSD